MSELTPRQRQTLCMVTLTNLEIGRRLGISHQTVKNLLTKVYRRLGVSSSTSEGKRTQALMLALRCGIVKLDEVEPPPISMLIQAGWNQERFRQMCEARWREMERCTGLI